MNDDGSAVEHPSQTDSQSYFQRSQPIIITITTISDAFNIYFVWDTRLQPSTTKCLVRSY